MREKQKVNVVKRKKWYFTPSSSHLSQYCIEISHDAVCATLIKDIMKEEINLGLNIMHVGLIFVRHATAYFIERAEKCCIKTMKFIDILILLLFSAEKTKLDNLKMSQEETRTNCSKPLLATQRNIFRFLCSL